MKTQLVTTPQAAEYIGGLRPNTLEGWRIRGEGPRYRKIGRLIRYAVADLDDYLEAQTRTSTSQKGGAA